MSLSDNRTIRLFDDTKPITPRRARTYSNVLTVDVNRKGVLDIDTVKGCSVGMSVRPRAGCYDACYAARIATFRGIDFSRSVTRHITSAAHADDIVQAVKAAPEGFFRVGTMGDPSHAWEHTIDIIEWLAPFAVPVVVTKHWITATNVQVERLVSTGAVINTSVSALDTTAELIHRERQMQRYASAGGVSIARVVSCDFNTDKPEGARMAGIQDRLLGLAPIIDNPLRVSQQHPLVTNGVIRIKSTKDLSQLPRPISIVNNDTYIGHCRDCPDKCGVSSCGPRHPRPASPQLSILEIL